MRFFLIISTKTFLYASRNLGQSLRTATHRSATLGNAQEFAVFVIRYDALRITSYPHLGTLR